MKSVNVLHSSTDSVDSAPLLMFDIDVLTNVTELESLL